MIDPSASQVIYDAVEKTAVLVRNGDLILFEGPFRSLYETARAVDRYLAGYDVSNVTRLTGAPHSIYPAPI